ncbi:MAG: hypothetical protein EZS28_051628, partial [Streblomastix strix]
RIRLPPIPSTFSLYQFSTPFLSLLRSRLHQRAPLFYSKGRSQR